jgi:nitrogen fixation protein FixH
MQKPLTGKHVLIILLSAFAVVFAVNMYFLYVSIHSLSGEQRGATYEAGLHYNVTLAEAKAQEALHWTHKAQLLPSAKLSVSLTDASGAPITGLAVDGWLERPSSNKADRKLSFKETGTGVYEAADEAPENGAWLLAFVAQKPQAGATPAVYRAKERVWVGPARQCPNGKMSSPQGLC